MAKKPRGASADEMLPFLRAIAAHPDEDAPRLVFADWLDEHDQPSRAEFIRLQIELARADPSADGYAEKTARMRRCGVFTHKGPVRYFDYFPTQKCKIGFRRGFIEVLDTANADRIDTAGFDLLPLLALRTGSKHIKKFQGCSKLKWLEYREWHATAKDLLAVLGPNGWFQELETLSLQSLDRKFFEAGVIPKFDLPKLRNLYLYSDEFSNLGDRDAAAQEDEYGRLPWAGLPDFVLKNALPNAKSPLERFVWHSSEDSDLFHDDEDLNWRGPSMEALLERLKGRALKQIELLVDHDDHENGAEGVRAAPHARNPLELSPTLECVTLDGNSPQLLLGATKRKLKSLRVYCDYDLNNHLFTLLQRPVCSELESFLLDIRRGWWGDTTGGPSINFARLKWLFLGNWLNYFAGCQFPQLVTLLGGHRLTAVQERRWPKLQTLEASFENRAELLAFAQSDCCPNLTTLNLNAGYSAPSKTDYSFLANCPHMPHLSLVRVSAYPDSGEYIVSDGQLLPVRADVMLDELAPSMPYRVRFAFSCGPVTP